MKGGLTGNIPYQSAPDTTAFLANGTSNYILQSNGVGNAPSWVNPSLGFNVDTANYATNAGISTNIKNGASNQIPYQTAANTTSFITAGTSGQVLIANASGVPTWGAVAGASQSGITIQEEGATVGTQLGISTVNFIGVGVTATSPVAGTANITISASAASNVTVTQTGYGACTNPITVTGGNAIGIGSTSNAYGTRYIQSTAPASACDGDIWYDTRGAGRILQVLNLIKSDQYALSSATPTSVPGLSLSITPSSASNKILIIAWVTLSTSGAGGDGYARLMRGATPIGNGNGGFFAQEAGQDYFGTHAKPITYLDSPATTSAVSYYMQVWGANTTYVNGRGYNGDFITSSGITLMEVLG